MKRYEMPGALDSAMYDVCEAFGRFRDVMWELGEFKDVYMSLSTTLTPRIHFFREDGSDVQLQVDPSVCGEYLEEGGCDGDPV